MLHAIHGETEPGGTPAADCFNCHATTPGGDMVLWDAAKHDQFHGITSAADVEGAFAWDQDYTVSADEMPNAQWMGNYYDEMRFNNERDGVPLDQVDIDEGATSFSWYSPDGNRAGYRGQDLGELEGHEAYLVYQINGEPLSWTNGYPCMLWIGGYAADHISKNVSEIRIGDDDYTLGSPFRPPSRLWVPRPRPTPCASPAWPARSPSPRAR